MATVTLKRTGAKMPLIGFGLWKVTKKSCADTVYNAIKAGYRLFDGAADYGNEKEAGEGVRKAIADGLVKREELWITSKIWNTNHKHEHAKAAAKYMLKLWGLDYFDLLLIHFPVSLEYIDPATKFPPEWWGVDGKTVTPVNVPIQETWTALEELSDEGIAKNIGISNFSGGLLYDLHRFARIEPQVLQIELHPYLSQKPILEYAKVLGLAVTGYSSLGPQSYIELGMESGHQNLLEHDVVHKVAAAQKKSVAQVLLRWATQQGVAVIPKSNNHHRVVDNLEANSFDLTNEEIKELDALNINLRMNNPSGIDPRLAIFA